MKQEVYQVVVMIGFDSCSFHLCTLFKLMKLAHKRDITLNRLIEDILRTEMNKKFSIKQDLKEIT